MALLDHWHHSVEPNEVGNFVIKDANGFALAYVYARTDRALQDKFLSPAEALAIAEAIANWSNQQPLAI